MRALPAGEVAIQLMGPTATGKTDLALRLASEFPIEIISVDSALVYKGMDVGTAKPSPRIMAAVPHHLVDIRDPAERYSAGAFRRDALDAMAAIRERGNIPLLVGGTLLYFRSLSEGFASLPVADPEIRAALDAQAERVGWPGMHAQLADVDPKSAERIHPNDGQRIQRALEVYALTGQPLSVAQNKAPAEPVSDIRYLKIGLVPENREQLSRIIDKRFKAMIEKGFVEEVEKLFRRPDLHADLPALRAVGYRQIWQFHAGECDLEEAVRRAQVATRRLAKRQMTWLRGEVLDAVFDPFAPDVATKVSDLVALTLGQQAESL